MKIIKITKVSPEYVYAVTTSTGTFIADGLAHHNCCACNMYKGGRIEDYYPFMLKKYGQKIIDELKQLRYAERKFTIQELEEMEKDYKKRTEKLLENY